MNANENIIVRILTEWKGKQALNSAKNDLSTFEAAASKVGKTLGTAFAGYKVAQFANASLKAFTADNLAAKQLALTLENLGLGFDSKRVEAFIQSTEKLTGVLDEQLRPAMQLFLNTTGSVVRSQSLLNTALNISRATGKDLASVSAALARAYQGNYTSLQRLGIGVDVATMKTQGFAAVQDNLNKKFAGAAKTAADSYQGSLDKLKVAADNAKEAIGKGMVDALAALSKSGTVDGAVGAIDRVSAALGRAIAGTGRFIAYTKLAFTQLKMPSQQQIGTIFGTGEAKPQTRGAGRLAVDLANQRALAEKKVTDAIKAKAMADAKANQALLKQKSDQLKLDQAAAALKKSQAIFDMQAIEIAAALQNDKITADEKLRLQMMATQDQLAAAIQDKNIPAVEALQKKLAELMGQFAAMANLSPFDRAKASTDAFTKSLQAAMDTAYQLSIATAGVDLGKLYSGSKEAAASGNTALSEALLSQAEVVSADAASAAADALQAALDAVQTTTDTSFTDILAQFEAALKQATQSQIQLQVFLDSQQIQNTLVNNTANGSPGSYVKSGIRDVLGW